MLYLSFIVINKYVIYVTWILSLCCNRPMTITVNDRLNIFHMLMFVTNNHTTSLVSSICYDNISNYHLGMKIFTLRAKINQLRIVDA